ncbi:MAG TPA: RNA methyltransferase [Rectinemataceae bacterium]|nr:RNA methyltransferase [Rectinemataceae bacterium]
MEPWQSSEPDLSRFVVVLCRAEEAGNVGSACRAMKTMGLERLILAGDQAYDEERVAMMAVHAYDVYERAERFPDLASALAGRSLSAGFTRRRGGRRKTFSVPVDEFVASLSMRSALGDIALVFGNEKSGLSGEEISLCSLAVHIPSSERFASLNLAQAVQVAAWELRRQAVGLRTGGYAAVGREAVAAAVERASLHLAELGFFRLNQGEELKEFLRDIAERSAFSASELRYFEAFIHKMAGLAAKGGG